MKKLIIIQTATPDYRAVFFKNIYAALGEKFELYGGDFYFEPTVTSHKSIKKKSIKNIFLLKRKFLFQTGIWHLILKKNVLVLELNPRIISNWIFLVIRGVFKKETYLWGHAWPRNGKESNTDWLRNIMRELSNGVIVYTRRQQKELQLKMPHKRIFSAPNSLFDKSMMGLTGKDKNKENIISVGRLVEAKKILFLVKAFKRGLDKLPPTTMLQIIGDGDEKQKIEKFIISNKLEDRIQLLGHISDYNKLKELYSKAYFSVSAGYIGLSVTQSFSFGVPMLVSKDENHSPEIEAVISNKNSLYFTTDDENDFISKLEKIFKEKEYWNKERKTIVDSCKKNYSTEVMAKVFIELL